MRKTNLRVADYLLRIGTGFILFRILQQLGENTPNRSFYLWPILLVIAAGIGIEVLRSSRRIHRLLIPTLLFEWLLLLITIFLDLNSEYTSILDSDNLIAYIAFAAMLTVHTIVLIRLQALNYNK